MIHVLLYSVTALFGCAFLGFLAGWFLSSRWQQVAGYLLDLGFLLLCLILFLEAMDLGVFLPIANIHQSLIFFAWSVMLMFMFARRGDAQKGFGLILSPLIAALLGLAIGQYNSRIMIPEKYLNDQLFAVHTLAAYFGYAAFALSFVASTLYLLQERALKKRWGGNFYRQLSSLEALEHMVYVTISLGVPFIAVTLLTGLLWSRQLFGKLWVWDAKVVMVTVTWLLYIYVLFLRFVRSYRGRRVMMHACFSFFFLLVTFAGTQLFMSQPVAHAY